MNIEVVADPQNWTHWEQAKAYLEPARASGNLPDVIRPHDELFAVLDGDELLAVATAWFDAENKFVEVRLVGGREFRRWVKELNEYIGARAMEAGATSMRAFGRCGWGKVLPRLGWAVLGESDGSTVYSRELRG